MLTIHAVSTVTDNHLGYAEKDPVRWNDSFETFEEMLQLAHTHKVDAIFHAGDMFHDNKPSRHTMTRTIELLKKYCLGDKPCHLQYCSDPRVDFGTDCVNFEDPNLNVSLPIFAIHGNHDDPTGARNLSAMDTVAATGLVNYFGKAADVDSLQLNPVLLRKSADTQVALFGVGSVRDERLHRLMRAQKVTYARPADGDWFNCLLMHQNRTSHGVGAKNYVPESFIDASFDLVVWGHEHESIVAPHVAANGSNGRTHIVQPGSSVATSLCDAEAGEKCAVLLRIARNTFHVTRIPLRTVRPFVIQDVNLAAHSAAFPDGLNSRSLSEFLRGRVSQLVSHANASGNGKLPLVRLRIDANGLENASMKTVPAINPVAFGHAFAETVANPRDIIHVLRRKPTPKQPDDASSALIDELAPVDDAELHGGCVSKSSLVSIERVIEEHLANQKLDVFETHELFDRVTAFVEKDDKDAIESWIKVKIGFLTSKIRGAVDVEDLKASIGRQNALASAKTALGFPQPAVVIAAPSRSKTIDEYFCKKVINDVDAAANKRLCT